jgi:hypothetical protein
MKGSRYRRPERAQKKKNRKKLLVYVVKCGRQASSYSLETLHGHLRIPRGFVLGLKNV